VDPERAQQLVWDRIHVRGEEQGKERKEQTHETIEIGSFNSVAIMTFSSPVGFEGRTLNASSTTISVEIRTEVLVPGRVEGRILSSSGWKVGRKEKEVSSTRRVSDRSRQEKNRAHHPPNLLKPPLHLFSSLPIIHPKHLSFLPSLPRPPLLRKLTSSRLRPLPQSKRLRSLQTARLIRIFRRLDGYRFEDEHVESVDGEVWRRGEEMEGYVKRRTDDELGGGEGEGERSERRVVGCFVEGEGEIWIEGKGEVVSMMD